MQKDSYVVGRVAFSHSRTPIRTEWRAIK